MVLVRLPPHPITQRPSAICERRTADHPWHGIDQSGDVRRGSGSDRGSKLGARTEKSSGKGKTQDKELKKLALVTESSGKDVFSLQPVHDGSLASLHRVQRLLAVVKRFMADLQSQGRSADEKSKTPPATPGGAAGLTSMDAMAKAYGTPALRKRACRTPSPSHP